MNTSRFAQGTEWIKIMVVSFFSALFAWYLIRFFSGLTTLYFSYDLNIKAKLLLSGIEFLVRPNNQVWTRDAVITVYLSAPIMNLILGMGFFVAYIFIPRKTQSFSFFMLWTIFFSLTLMFGTFVENGLERTGVYRVSQIMHVGDIALVLSVVVALYFLYLTGLSIGKLIMLNINPKYIHEDHIKASYFIFAFIIPWILVFLLSVNELKSNMEMIYMLGIVILLPFLWTKGVETKGIRLKPLPPFLWIDVVSTILFVIGFLLLHQFLNAGIVLG